MPIDWPGRIASLIFSRRTFFSDTLSKHLKKEHKTIEYYECEDRELSLLVFSLE